MTTLQTEDNNCQTNDPNNLLPMDVESSLQFPLDSSMRIVFTGHYNGYGVEVKSPEEGALLYHMGCFGKGTSSRSRPRNIHSEHSPPIMRKRQFQKRSFWYKKFGTSVHISESDKFLKDIEALTAKIITDSERESKKDVIDLVSSDDEVREVTPSPRGTMTSDNKEDIVVIVPNSDSEEDDYFSKLKPKCCVDKIKLTEKLMLTLQEAFFLLHGLGCFQIIHKNTLLDHAEAWKLFMDTDDNFLEKYIVYHYFRSKGYIVKPGIKFGGDYLLYKEGPEVHHAEYIVVIKHDDISQNWILVLGHVRMAATTVKEVLIAEVIKPITEKIKMPEDLNTYSVREIVLSRKIPVTLNNDVD